MNIGENIKKRMKELDVQQKELAELSNIGEQSISRIINNKQKTNAEYIGRIAIALHTTTDKLIFDEDEINEDDELKRLLIEIKNMNEENKKLAKKMIKALIIQNKSQELKV